MGLRRRLVFCVLCGGSALLVLCAVAGGTRAANAGPAFACSGYPSECDDGNPCTVDTCDSYYGCQHEPLDGGVKTCGLGACRRSAIACDNGVPQPCTPGNPKREVCNGIDDDCDGFVDEGGYWVLPSGRRFTCDVAVE